MLQKLGFDVQEKVRSDERYSIADQVKRFNAGKKAKSERMLNIDAIYDGSYLKGKRVLITGANRGLGYATMVQLVSDGAHVIAVLRTKDEATVAKLTEIGCAQVITGCDVTSLEQVAAMASNVEGGSIDIIINNAGYFTTHKETMDAMNFGEEMKQIDVCALGPLRISSELRKAGKVANGTKIIIISSQAGSAAWRKVQNANEGGDYGHHMSRAACNIGAVLMAEELRKEGVSVTILHPGFNRTDMTRKYASIWDVEGAVDSSVGAKRVLYEVARANLEQTGIFINCEDGLLIPW